MIDANETFGGTWPFAPRYFEGNGFPMHYVDEGAGAPVICLHGNPTWGYLYRKFVAPLSQNHRVVVPDHMGFGKSATPRDRDYSGSAHVENLASLIEFLDLQDITLVVQDYGGFIGCTYTALHPERVKRLFLLNTISCYGLAPRELISPWFELVEELLGHLDGNILSLMQRIGLENACVVDANWVAYSAPFPTKEDAVGSIRHMLDALLGRIAPYIKETHSSLENLKAKPAMLTVGMKDKALAPERQIADFQAVWPGSPIIKLPHAGHFSQEDAPEAIIALIQQFIQTT